MSRDYVSIVVSCQHATNPPLTSPVNHPTMPPKAAGTARRNGPSFNPPRPVKPAAHGATNKRAPSPAASRPTGAKKAAAARSDFLPAAAIISSDEEPEEDEEIEPSDLDELMEDVPEEDIPQPNLLDTTTPPIPPPLLARLLHQNFEDDNTQIQKGAMSLFGSYMSIFVREALARAKDERDKAAKRGVGRSEAFLQVEDLERLAPQLVLDF
jgi:hypothetical protein